MSYRQETTDEAMAHLREAGFRQDDDGQWVEPSPQYQFTADDFDAINWLWHHA